VFVDYFNKKENERPDFYILSPSEWQVCVKKKIRDRKKKGLSPVVLGEYNEPIFPKEITKSGKPRVGMTVPIYFIEAHKDSWSKISDGVKNA